MKILDLSAGRRAVWFNKDHPDCTFIDVRPEVSPTIVCDSRELPPEVGNGYDLLVFDPPHVNFGERSQMSKTYGWHTTLEIRDIVRRTSDEAFRVSTDKALMAFKWNTHDVPLGNIMSLMPRWEPLFGTPIASRAAHRSTTFWVLLRKWPN